MHRNYQILKDELENEFGRDRLRNDEPLSRHCNWKVGGPADFFLIVRSATELIKAVRRAHQFSCPVTILGFGANVLVSDKGMRGLVVLNRAEGIRFCSDNLVDVDSGTNLAVLARRAMQQGLADLEFLIGIPGTVGAAVFGNAGTGQQWISEILKSVQLLGKDGQIFSMNNSELEFTYRSSRLQKTGEVVLSAQLQGKSDEPEKIKLRMNEFLRLRKNQPSGSSTGSVFKNPSGHFAGKLIEKCGLKGTQIGGAKISEKHANFIINENRATASEIKKLIDMAKSQVEKKFGIQLEEEICYLGDGF